MKLTQKELQAVVHPLKNSVIPQLKKSAFGAEQIKLIESAIKKITKEATK